MEVTNSDFTLLEVELVSDRRPPSLLWNKCRRAKILRVKYALVPPAASLAGG